MSNPGQPFESQPDNAYSPGDPYLPGAYPPYSPGYPPVPGSQPPSYQAPYRPAPPGYGYQPGYPGPYIPYPAPPGTNAMAIASMITSIVGSFLCPGISSIVGIVLGIIALNQIKQAPQEGRGLAIAGIVIGGLVLVALVIWLAVLLAIAGSTHSPHTY